MTERFFSVNVQDPDGVQVIEHVSKIQLHQHRIIKPTELLVILLSRSGGFATQADVAHRAQGLVRCCSQDMKPTIERLVDLVTSANTNEFQCEDNVVMLKEQMFELTSAGYDLWCALRVYARLRAEDESTHYIDPSASTGVSSACGPHTNTASSIMEVDESAQSHNDLVANATSCARAGAGQTEVSQNAVHTVTESQEDEFANGIIHWFRNAMKLNTQTLYNPAIHWTGTTTTTTDGADIECAESVESIESCAISQLNVMSCAICKLSTDVSKTVIHTISSESVAPLIQHIKFPPVMLAHAHQLVFHARTVADLVSRHEGIARGDSLEGSSHSNSNSDSFNSNLKSGTAPLNKVKCETIRRLLELRASVDALISMVSISTVQHCIQHDQANEESLFEAFATHAATTIQEDL